MSAIATLRDQQSNNLELWSKYGRHVLMMMPYADEVIASAEGSWLRDVEGKQILDLASGMFCALVGHQHPKVTKRIQQQMGALLHTGTQYLSLPVLEASARLAEVSPGDLSQSILLSTGTEANEFAIWVARNLTGRQTILGFSRGYYGTSIATKSCSSLFSDNSVAVPGFARLPLGNACLGCFRETKSACGAACLDTIEEMLAPELNDLAGILVEPILSAGGMLYPPVSYMQRLKRLCEERGALFIADEAQTCLGRTGKWFAIEHYDIIPDLLVLAKGAGNGFPVSAVVMNDELAERLMRKWKFHLSSHQSDPVPAAALAAVIEVVREENLPAAAAEKGQYFKNGLQSLAERFPILHNVRGMGLMLAFDLVGDADSVQAFMLGCRQRGVHVTYTFASPTIRILPPLTISCQEIDFALERFAEVLDQLARGEKTLTDAAPKNPFTAKLMSRSGWRRWLRRWSETTPEQWLCRLRHRFP